MRMNTPSTVPVHGQNTLVPSKDTVPAKVEFRDRKFTDVWWAVTYILSYVTFIICGVYLCTQAHPRYTKDSDGFRVISDHYMEDAQTCCEEDTNGNSPNGMVCMNLRNADGSGRRLQAGNSKFSGDEGMFEAFLEAPEIIVGLLALTIFSAFTWVVLLRFFSKPIVILTEVFKIGVFITMGILQQDAGTRVICWLIAIGLIAWDWWAREKILFAADILKHATVAMKARPSIFLGSTFVKVLFAGNALLFVIFFARSFEVTEVTKSTNCYENYYTRETTCDSYCEFESPSYVNGIAVFCSLSYLWTILLLDKMRLSIIATIVGSWHFHPEDKPGVCLAIKNIGKSFGTLSVASLISAIAEKIIRMSGQDCWKSWISPTICITFPFQLLVFLIGTCFRTILQMLTKFAVILHVFSGKGFLGSGKSVYKIMSRHFKGGFVTELTSKSVLTLASYVFSCLITMLTWRWINDAFDCGDLIGNSSDRMYVTLLFLVTLFTLWYPVLGLYIIIIVNRFLQRMERNALERELENDNDNDDHEFENTNHIWIPILSAAFVGCIAMMFFTFLAKIFLDVVDTIFLCFAIDKDNNVDMRLVEFEALIKKMPEYIEATATISTDPESVATVPYATPIATAVTVEPAKPSAPPAVYKTGY